MNNGIKEVTYELVCIEIVCVVSYFLSVIFF